MVGRKSKYIFSISIIHIIINTHIFDTILIYENILNYAYPHAICIHFDMSKMYSGKNVNIINVCKYYMEKYLEKYIYFFYPPSGYF